MHVSNVLCLLYPEVATASLSLTREKQVSVFIAVTRRRRSAEYCLFCTRLREGSAMTLLLMGALFAIAALLAWYSDRKSGGISRGRVYWCEEQCQRSADGWFNEARVRFRARSA